MDETGKQPRRRRMGYEQYMRSPKWVAVREAAFQRDGYRCRLCNRGDALQAHHRCYPKDWADDTADNVTTLCARCHLFIAEERAREERYKDKIVEVYFRARPEPLGRNASAVEEVRFEPRPPPEPRGRNNHEPNEVKFSPRDDKDFRRIR